MNTFLLCDPCEVRFLGTCNEFLVEYSSYKNQICNAWMISKKDVSSISCILQMFYMVCVLYENSIVQLTFVVIKT
jgi:hypothetical protein